MALIATVMAPRSLQPQLTGENSDNHSPVTGVFRVKMFAKLRVYLNQVWNLFSRRSISSLREGKSRNAKATSLNNPVTVSKSVIEL